MSSKLYAQQVLIPVRCNTCSCLKSTCQCARTRLTHNGQVSQRNGFVDMFIYPVLDAMNAGIKVGTVFQIDTHLMRAPVPAHVNHKLPGDLSGEAGTTISFKQPEGHINA